jgi:hypothetical protein
MTKDSHERAVRLMSAEQVEGLSAEDRRWLYEHLSACTGCSKKADALRVGLASLRSVSVRLNPALLDATRRRVRSRAVEIEELRVRVRAVALVAILSLVWMGFTGSVTWQAFEWLGRSLGWVDGVCLSAFVLGWFLPATVAALILSLKRGEWAEPVEE